MRAHQTAFFKLSKYFCFQINLQILLICVITEIGLGTKFQTELVKKERIAF